MAPNFGLLASDADWRGSWAWIIAGRFSTSYFNGLLFIEEGTGYTELYDTDGAGHIVGPRPIRFDPPLDRVTWSHIVPGFFGPQGFTGLLLYDQAAGFGRIYDFDGQETFTLLSENADWRTSWTHIVTGRFDVTSPYSSLFFYDAAAYYGETWATRGAGLVDTQPVQKLQLSQLWLPPAIAQRVRGPEGLLPSWKPTHVLAGEFYGTPDYIETTPSLTDLFFYDAASGLGLMFRTAGPKESLIQEGFGPLVPTAVVENLPRNATHLATGNFGGFGSTDLAFYDVANGVLSFYGFYNPNELVTELVLIEQLTGLRSTTSLLVPGIFSMLNPEDHWINDGPLVQGEPAYHPEWRFGTGSWTNFLMYDRAAYLGEFYYHEPLPPPREPLEGYVSSITRHNEENTVSTGSVQPGEEIAIFVSSQVGPYAVTIYQVGWFGDGLTERSMATIDGLPTNPASLGIPPNAYRDGAQWDPVATFTIPQDWPSGLYLARVAALGAPAPIDLLFVVRAAAGTEQKLLLVVSDCTSQAYNTWGGRSLYGNLSGNHDAPAFRSASAWRIPVAFELSFDRPNRGYNIQDMPEGPFLRWLARSGIPVDVCTLRDVHFGRVSQYPLVVFAGHHEYWSYRMRDNIESYVDAGGHVAFFTGNTCWWQIRLSEDGRQLTCYKFPGYDPFSRSALSPMTTGHWFEAPVLRPETALTGVSYLGNTVGFPDDPSRFSFEVVNAEHWAFSGLDLGPGALFGIYGSSLGDLHTVVAGEGDRVQDDPSFYNAWMRSPDGYRIARARDNNDNNYEFATMGSFTRGAGEVFNAAVVNWGFALDYDAWPGNLMPGITRNVISHLGGLP
jgi:hypothetical protein